MSRNYIIYKSCVMSCSLYRRNLLRLSLHWTSFTNFLEILVSLFKNIFLNLFFFLNSQKNSYTCLLLPSNSLSYSTRFFHSTIFRDKQFHWCHDSSRKKKKTSLIFRERKRLRCLSLHNLFLTGADGKKRKAK